MMKHFLRLALMLMLVPLCLAGCHKQAQPLTQTRLLLDTVCTVTLYAPQDAELLQQALDLCEAYEKLFSRTVEGSDIWQINHAAGQPVQVDPATAELIGIGLAYGDFSAGLFDITVGRLSELWRFNDNPRVPTAEELAAALATVDYRQVSVDGNTVRLSNPQTHLELGGIAKGYIADQIAAFLRAAGVQSALIDLGGNIVTIGAKPDGAAWRIGVEQPFSERRQILGSLSVGEASVVTSGIYERQFTANGRLYHHILDPASGLPVESDIVSDTIVTQSSTAGDALSTIILIAGSERAAALLAQAEGLTGALLSTTEGEILQYGTLDFQAAP